MASFRRHITAAERRARLGHRHLLAATSRVKTPEGVTNALIGLHATDPATVFLSAAARLAEPDVAMVERALYEERTLARIRCMRGTMFVVPAPLAPAVQSATGKDTYRDRAAAIERLGNAVGWDERRYTAAEQEAVAALAARGELTAAELAAAVPALAEQITVYPGKSYESRQRVCSTVLGALAAEGRIRRARPAGNWTSAQFRWAPADPLPQVPVAEARATLARHYLAAFGPVTEADLKWWTGWTLTDTRKAIAAGGAEAVDLDEGTGYLMPDDTEPVDEPLPWVALLPGLDPTPMGWRDRHWYLDPDLVPALFDRNGNIGPTVWANGRIVGAWAQRPDGRINHGLLTDPGGEARAAIEAETARLTDFLAGTRITPSYRTPLERRLAQ
ncbi:winged helix DNA-binding domain-containing protein [Streptomyces piniterrae]|uniref:Winged helix DNA-binding domain-containing protein n=1 Tax=Streptomyces piniterrae TaxID=2571125 RepID=A0A4U0MU39_9ACTN|nr:winged helix DNA-binding domain-containing protein [Streptomyces piniterrae]TJZ44507.1 winged helix DNA-binding domain-containing protein [Streptomyces piniterrae]